MKDRLGPAALQATPGAQLEAQISRHPTHQPKPAGDNRQQEMHAVMNLVLLKYLFVPTAWAKSANPIVRHTLMPTHTVTNAGTWLYWDLARCESQGAIKPLRMA
jgi:hypothetical protein